MQKKIVIISIALMAFAFALAGNSWAARESGGNRHMNRGNRFKQEDKAVHDNFNRGRLRGRSDGHFPRRDFKRPGPHLKNRYLKRRHFRTPDRFRPKFRHRRHRPVYRHGHPGYLKWRQSRSLVHEINNYYSNAEDYAVPAEEFQASASVSESGFSVSVGASKTN